MAKKFVQLEFYETYYHANIISNIIDDPFEYLRNIHEWYEDNEEAVFLPAFPKNSRLHQFSTHIINSLVDENISDIEVDSFARNESNEIWLDQALKYHGIQCSVEPMGSGR